MTTYTTKSCTELLYSDDYRSNGNPDVVVVENESATVQVEATASEIEAFEASSSIPIDSDVLPDEVIDQLVEFLNLERFLDLPISDSH
jgi:hypothetical protein